MTERTNINEGQRPDGSLVVWDTYQIKHTLSENGEATLAVGDCIDHFTARGLEHKLHNNSEVSYESTLGRGRPASAYYLLLGGKLYMLWGLIDKKGCSKLHDYLRDDPLYVQRRNNPKTVFRSGHVATVILPGKQEPTRVALFDSTSNGHKLSPNRPEYYMSIALLENGILPITTDGYPVQFETIEGGDQDGQRKI